MLATAAAAALTSSAAFASISVVGMTPVAISANAITDSKINQGHGTLDLSNYAAYDLQVSISADDKWAAADIRATLNGSPGVFFAAQPSDGQYSISFKTGSAPNRFLPFDTALMFPGPVGGFSPLGSSSLKPGGADSTATFPSNGTNQATGVDSNGDPTAYAPANDQRILDAAWGNTSASSGPSGGIFSIARLDLPKAPAGYDWRPTSAGALDWARVAGKVKMLSDANAQVPYSFFLVPVPEPTSIALMGLGLGAATLRRRKA